METTEKPKRTYQKHKTEKKITVKHFLNTTIKEYSDFGDELYPVYVQVTYNRKTTKFRSQVPASPYKYLDLTPDFDSDEEYYKYYMNMGENHFENALQRDADLIKWLINERGGEFDINDLPKLYHKKFYSIPFFVEWCLKQEIQNMIFNSGVVKFKYNDFELEYNLDNIHRIVPIMSSISSLNHFEFYVKDYPFINSLKEKYSSNVWNLGIYIEIMTSSSLAGIHWTFGKFQNMYADFEIYPTLIDFKERWFQSHFLNCFNDEQFAKDIIIDVEKLYLEYFEQFKEIFIEKRGSNIFGDEPPKETFPF